MYWDKKRRAWMAGIRPAFLITFLVVTVLLATAAVTQIDLTAQVKGILAVANGGTGTAYFGVTGPTVARTYTFPDANATVEVQANKAAAGGYASLDGSTKVVQNPASATATPGNDKIVMSSGTGTISDSWLSSLVTKLGTAIGISELDNADCTDGQIPKKTSGAWACGADDTGGAAQNFGNEAPTGTVDGSNATFTLTNSPNPTSSLMLYKNGQLMAQGASADYQITGNTITYTSGAKPKTGDVHFAAYRY